MPSPFTFDQFLAREFGGRPWVIGRCSPAMRARYGDDVVCLSQKAYRALAKSWEIETAELSPAYPFLKKLFGNHCDAVNIIRGLREEGLRIERVPHETA